MTTGARPQVCSTCSPEGRRVGAAVGMGRCLRGGKAGCCAQPPMRTTGHQRKQLLLMSSLRKPKDRHPLSVTRCPSRTSHCSTWGGDISGLLVFQSPRLPPPCAALDIHSNTVGWFFSNACCSYLVTVVGERVREALDEEGTHRKRELPQPLKGPLSSAAACSFRCTSLYAE